MRKEHGMTLKPTSGGTLTAKIEPFDSFWEALENIERGYSSYYKFYKRNYLKYIP
jgi:hypothetical protein